MDSRVIPLRLDAEILELIDRLVKLGAFNSRSEALREFVKAGVKRYEYLTRVIEGVEKLLEIERKEGEIPIRLGGALKQLLEERRGELHRYERHSGCSRPLRS